MNPRKSRFTTLTLALALGLTAAGNLGAQDEEVIELNPFVVDASQDEGYDVSNTTSATRMNEAIKDLPMNIQALSGALLEDIAATDMMEALQHVTNVEPTQDPNDREINFRGINSRFMRRNGFVWYNPTDNYSTERIEVVRGPNSLLYGQSEPGGLINTITKKPIWGKNLYSGKVRADDYGSLRFELDANFGDLIGNDKWALRIAAMDTSDESWIDLYNHGRQGLYITTAYRITDKMTFRIEFEDGEIDEGKRLQSMETYNGVQLPEAVGVNGEPLLGTLIQKDEARTWSGLDDQWIREYENISYYLEGTLLEDRLSYQLVHNVQEQSQNGHQIQGTNTIRYGNFTDTPTGTAFTNSYFVRGQRQAFSNGNTVTTDQITLSYKFELFGTRQNLIAGYERRTDDFYLYNRQERQDNGNAAGGARKNWDVAMEGGNDWTIGIPLDQAATGFVFKNQFGIENEETTDAYFVALSGKYFNDRLHVVTGWRRDDYYKYGRNPNANTDYDDDPDNDTPFVLEDEDVIDSYNAGFNFGINDRVNLYYNYSESFKAPGAFRQTPERELLTPAIGSGHEIGLKFDTEDRRFSGTASYYKIDFESDQVNIGGNSAERNAIDPNSPLNGRHGSNWLALDTGSSGVEFQLVANLNQNFRLQFGYGYIIEAEVTQDFAMQANFNDSFLVGSDGNPVNASGNPIPLGDGFVTLNDIIWSADGQVATNANALGLVGSGESGLKTNPYTGQVMPVVTIRETGDKTDPWSRHNLNIVAMYTWKDGALKGFRLGATVRGRYDNFAGSGSTNPSYTVFDLIIGYNKKFRKVTWSSQVNIQNLFDKEYFLGRQYTHWGDERTFVWTNTIRF